MFSRVSACLSILDKTPEIDIAFIQGHRWTQVPMARGENKRFKGLLYRLVSLLHFVISNVGVFPSRMHPVDCLVFACTRNQTSVLKFIVQEMRGLGCGVAFVATKDAGAEDVYRLKLSLSDIACGALVFLVRFRKLLSDLRRTGNQFGVSNNFNVFCMSHFYIPYFIRVLSAAQPKICLQSNDHTVAPMSFLMAAKYLKIKTAYVQHAAINENFPPLQFDYSFLDGESSLDFYRTASPTGREIFPIKRYIFLTGVKRKLVRQEHLPKAPTIGVALNLLDDVDKVIVAIKLIAKAGFKSRVRLHPSLGESAKKAFLEKASQIEGVDVTLSYLPAKVVFT